VAREIKFRAWNTINKEMSDVFNHSDLINANLHHIYPKYDPDDYIVMQYTGLRDKNGKEIYGGDVLNLNGTIYEVYFDKGCFLVRMKEYPDNRMELMQIYNRSVIIGNKFENPELLDL